MADPNAPFNFDIQPENDFEKISAPGTVEGFEAGEGLNASGSGAGEYDPQDGEVSTTTENIHGEDEAEEDRYNAIGASEPDVLAPSPDPLISFEDDEPRIQEDPWEGQGAQVQVQPSAPVPETENVIEPLIDFGSSSEQDIKVSAEPSAPAPSITNLEPIPTSTSSSKPPQIDDFNDFEVEAQSESSSKPPQIDDFNDFEVEAQSESSSKPVTESQSESSQPVESSKGSLLKGLDPRVVDLIYWRDVKKTGVVFGSMLVVLLSLAIFSLVSVVAYLSLAALTVTFSFVVYKKIMGAVQKSNDGHPFKCLLEKDVALSEDKLKTVIQALLKNLNRTISELRRLFLIEDIVDSMKFGLLLWILTYVGCLMNGITIIILDVILLFSLPKVYETYQVQIDNYIDLAKGHINNVLAIIQSKVPFLKKKDKAQ